MINNAMLIGKYNFTEQDNLLLDANIWLYLLPAPSSAKNYATRVYSAAFKSMITAGAKIFVNSLVLSEYLNRYCRLEWNALHKVKYPDFKDFRQSIDYNDVGQNAAIFAKTILRNAERSADEFSEIDVNAILKNFELGFVDFNDGLIAAACFRNSWTLVTHDRDFTLGGINVLTDNNKLIAGCAKASNSN